MRINSTKKLRNLKKSLYSKKSKKLQGLLIEARKAAALTQQELATTLNRPQSFVAKYEGGERRLDVIEFTHICANIGVNAASIIQKLED